MEAMRVCRGRLLEYMLGEHGLPAWTEYWNTLHSFVIGR